jgi:hypothetical protein
VSGRKQCAHRKVDASRKPRSLVLCKKSGLQQRHRAWSLVAVVSDGMHGGMPHTWTELLHDGIDVLRFDTVDDVVAGSRHEMTGSQDVNIRLVKLSTALFVYDIYHGCPTLLRNSSTNASNLSGMSQATTLSCRLAYATAAQSENSEALSQ